MISMNQNIEIIKWIRNNLLPKANYTSPGLDKILLQWFDKMNLDKTLLNDEGQFAKLLELMIEYQKKLPNQEKRDLGNSYLKDLTKFSKQFKPIDENDFHSRLLSSSNKIFVGTLTHLFEIYPHEKLIKELNKKLIPEEVEQLKLTFKEKKAHISIPRINLEIINPYSGQLELEQTTKKELVSSGYNCTDFSENLNAILLKNKGKKECEVFLGEQFMLNSVQYSDQIILDVISSLYAVAVGDVEYKLFYSEELIFFIHEFQRFVSEFESFGLSHRVREFVKQAFLPYKNLRRQAIIINLISNTVGGKRLLEEIATANLNLLKEEKEFVQKCNIPVIDDRLIVISKILKTQIPLLLLGETGTGKTRLAKIIHEHNNDNNTKPFITLNCAAIPSELIESELFGYIKGAFSGAAKDTKGKIHAADGGTLFLDEFTSAPTGMQDKLLTFIESGEFRKVGATTTEKAEVRIICATNRNIKESLRSGLIRSDFYFRIANFPIELPPLRKMPFQMKHYAIEALERANEELHVTKPVISPQALEAMSKYQWPGNQRQLTNTLRQCLADCLVNDENIITLDMIEANYTEDMMESKLKEFESLLEELFREWVFRRKDVESLMSHDLDPMDLPKKYDFMKCFIEPVAVNMFIENHLEDYNVREISRVFGLTWTQGNNKFVHKSKEKYKYIKEIFG